MGIPIDGVARAAYIVGHLDKFLEMLNDADEAHSCIPRKIRKELDAAHDMESLNASAMSNIAYELGKYPPELIASLRQTFFDIRRYVGVWVEEEDEEPQFFGMLDKQDVHVIEEMVTFMQKLGHKSIKQLLQFLQSANDGEWGTLILQSKGSASEVRHRHRLSEPARAEFDLE